MTRTLRHAGRRALRTRSPIALTLALWLAAMAAWSQDYKRIDWQDLIPSGLDQNPGEAISHDGDPFDPELQAMDPIVLERTLVKQLDKTRVALAGFIVPLNLNAKDRVDEFLLVPYFGACIHVPPPPPNQIVHVRFPEGLDPMQLYEPFTIEGALAVGGVDSAVAQAGYAITADRATLYEY